MDVNGTRFHLRLGLRDWEPIIESAGAPPEAALAWDPNLTQSLPSFRAAFWDETFGGVSLTRRVPRFEPLAGDRELPLSARRGAGVDRYGNVFWIDTARTGVRIQPAGLERAGQYFSLAALLASLEPAAGAFKPVSSTVPDAPLLRGLCVTRTHVLVVGTLAPGGLIVCDLHSAAAPRWWVWPEAIDFQPLAFAPAHDGGLLVIDRNDSTGESRLWRLDCTLRGVALAAPVVLERERPADFFPEGGEPARLTAHEVPGAISLGVASALGAAQPLGVAELGDGSVLVLDAGAPGQPARVLRIRNAEQMLAVDLDARLTHPTLGEPILDALAFSVIPNPDAAPGTQQGKLHIVTRRDRQAFSFAYHADGDEFRLELEPVMLPLQGHTGKALVARGSESLYDIDDRWIPLAEQPRYQYFPQAEFESEALIFDGKQAGCVWHRLVVDACVPAGSAVEFESRAANEMESLPMVPWRREPALHRRQDGSEQPFNRPFSTSIADHSGTFETLLQSAVGRFLQIRMAFRSDGRVSPKLRALRVYYPRFSYLNAYLPGIYREDAASAQFLDRFLANVEGIFTSIEDRIAHAEVVLDPAVAPPEYLDWLGAWMGTVLDPSWGEVRRRLFVQHAWLLARWRGTSMALLAMLRLALDPCPTEAIFRPLLEGRCCDGRQPERMAGLRIVENFQLRSFSSERLGGPGVVRPSLVGPEERWEPRHGSDALHARFSAWVQQRYESASQAVDGTPNNALQRLNDSWEGAEHSAFSQIKFSAVTPAGSSKAADWRDFADSEFSFRYPTVGVGDAGFFREFLARRYAVVSELNQAWGRSGNSRFAHFAAVPMPLEDEFPSQPTALRDWLDFVSTALSIRRNAHRFTVLVPAYVGEPPDTRTSRLERALAIAQREKPGHTHVEAKLFWALFQVGTGRVGIDTVAGEGARFVAAVLDAGYLGQSYLAEGHPWTATGRPVVGRDRQRG